MSDAVAVELLQAGATPAGAAAHIVIARLILALADDDELRAMCEANDLEHFVEGCASPAFEQKVGLALAELRAA